MALYAKVKTSTSIIEAVGSDNTAASGYHFKEFYPHISWGAELVGFEISSNVTDFDSVSKSGFPHENLFVE